VKHSSGTLGGGDLHSVRVNLAKSEIQRSRQSIRENSIRQVSGQTGNIFPVLN
jgi:hypothetical protein